MARNKKHPLFLSRTISIRVPQWALDNIMERTSRGDIDRSELIVGTLIKAKKWKPPVIDENGEIEQQENK